jgi:peptide subunit release factor 1 (eRF1)
VDFDKIMRLPGFWKLNNSHLENEYFKQRIKNELLHLVNENQTDEEGKTLIDLDALNPEELQKVGLKLNPHEMMEQIHYRLKERIIN